MSQAQLLEIEKTLLSTLTIQELKDFVFNLIQKATPKKPKKKISINNPKHPFYDKLSPAEEKDVLKSLAEHKAGKGVLLSTIEEMQNYFYNLN
jgi:hypothetical protein